MSSCDGLAFLTMKNYVIQVIKQALKFKVRLYGLSVDFYTQDFEAF